MDPLLTIAGLMTVGMITPGPNNLIVMREAARAGLRGALPAGLGIISGGLALLTTATLATSTLSVLGPRALELSGVGASLILAALGLKIIAASFVTAASASPSLPSSPSLPARVAGVGSLFIFQFLNPKAWILALAIASFRNEIAQPIAGFVQLAVLFVVIPAGCLSLWSIFGWWLMRSLEHRSAQVWLDRLTGSLLFALAVLHSIGGLDVIS